MIVDTSQINPVIYDKLFTTPVIVYATNPINSLGDATLEEPVTYYGYILTETKKVVNQLGDEVLSGTQIYLRGEDIAAIDIHSKVTCEDSVQQPILAATTYRTGKSKPFIGILYLP